MPPRSKRSKTACERYRNQRIHFIHTPKKQRTNRDHASDDMNEPFLSPPPMFCGLVEPTSSSSFLLPPSVTSVPTTELSLTQHPVGDDVQLPLSVLPEPSSSMLSPSKKGPVKPFLSCGARTRTSKLMSLELQEFVTSRTCLFSGFDSRCSPNDSPNQL